MTKSLITAAALLSVAAGAFVAPTAQAEVMVEESNGDLIIEYYYGSTTEEMQFVYWNGIDVTVTEENGRVKVTSNDPEVMVEGSPSQDYAFPSDDIIIQFTPYQLGPNRNHSVYVHGIDMTDKSDDLKVYVEGYATVAHCTTRHRSHSSIFVNASYANVYRCNVRDDYVLSSPKRIRLEYSYAGNDCRIQTKSGWVDLTIRNSHIVDDLDVSLGAGNDAVFLEEYVHVGNRADIDLGPGRDTIEIDMPSYSSLGDAMAIGGDGYDVIYQNADWFIQNVNTTGVQYITDLP